jgi:hypothetical protein
MAEKVEIILKKVLEFVKFFGYFLSFKENWFNEALL